MRRTRGSSASALSVLALAGVAALGVRSCPGEVVSASADQVVLPPREIIERLPASPSIDASTLDVAEQNALADQYRADLLRALSPDDWYLCYQNPKPADFNQPRYGGLYQAIQKANVSEAQFKPFAQKQVFNHFVSTLWLMAGGADVPKEALYNCHNMPSPSPAVQRAAGRRLLAGLTAVLGQVLQVVGIDQRASLAARAIREVEVDDGPHDRARTDEEMAATSREGLLAAESIVRAYLSEDAAAAFQMDGPEKKAEKLVRAAGNLMAQRKWPNAWFLTMASAGLGPGAGYWELSNFYRNDAHPDVTGWNSMTEYQKGEAFRRMYAEKLRLHIEIAAGRMTPEQYASARRISLQYDWNRIVGEAFGLGVLNQYRKGTATDPQLEQIRSAAYAYMIAMQTITLLAM